MVAYRINQLKDENSQITLTSYIPTVIYIEAHMFIFSSWFLESIYPNLSQGDQIKRLPLYY
jgi:hypothetical protein